MKNEIIYILEVLESLGSSPTFPICVIALFAALSLFYCLLAGGLNEQLRRTEKERDDLKKENKALREALLNSN